MNPLFDPLYLWLLAALVLLLCELLTTGFFVLCIACGAFVAMLPASLGASLIWQVLAFCVGSILSLVLLRPMLCRLNRGKSSTATGVAALYGRRVKVTETIDPLGRISADGDSWRARLEDEYSSPIPIGSYVEVVSNDSTVLIVRPVPSGDE